MTTPKDIVTRFLRAWADNDMQTAMAYLAPNPKYTLYLSEDLLPFGGETTGRENVEAAMRQIRSAFDYILFRPYAVKEEGDTVRVRVEFMYRHIGSGEVLTGRFRLVMHVEDGLLVAAEEYHDRAMVEAFMRLYGASSPEAT